MEGKQKWVKVPRLGEMRGEGEWTKLGDTLYSEEQWYEMSFTGYMPTREQDEKPE